MDFVKGTHAHVLRRWESRKHFSNNQKILPSEESTKQNATFLRRQREFENGFKIYGVNSDH